MIRVAFYKGRRGGWKGFWDWVVRTISRGPYSHCELILPDGRWYSSTTSEGCHFDNGPLTKALSPDWDIVSVPCGCENVRRFCVDELGSSYDWFGVIRFAIPIFQESPERWFCSEICAAALQTGGRMHGIWPHKLSPTGLYKALNQASINDEYFRPAREALNGC